MVEASMLSSSSWTPEVFWGNFNDRFYSPPAEKNDADRLERRLFESPQTSKSTSILEILEDTWTKNEDASSDGEDGVESVSPWLPDDLPGSSLLETLQVNDLGFSLLDEDWNYDGMSDTTELSVPSSPCVQDTANNTRCHLFSENVEVQVETSIDHSSSQPESRRENHTCSSTGASEDEATTSGSKKCSGPSKASRRKLQFKKVKRPKMTQRKPIPPSQPHKKVHQQVLKERRSGLFHREQVVSLQPSISEEEIDILG